MTTSPTPASPSPEQKMRNVTADALRHIAIALTDPHQAKFATYYEQADHILSALQSSGCLKVEGAERYSPFSEPPELHQSFAGGKKSIASTAPISSAPDGKVKSESKTPELDMIQEGLNARMKAESAPDGAGTPETTAESARLTKSSACGLLWPAAKPPSSSFKWAAITEEPDNTTGNSRSSNIFRFPLAPKELTNER